MTEIFFNYISRMHFLGIRESESKSDLQTSDQVSGARVSAPMGSSTSILYRDYCHHQDHPNCHRCIDTEHVQVVSLRHGRPCQSAQISSGAPSRRGQVAWLTCQTVCGLAVTMAQTRINTIRLKEWAHLTISRRATTHPATVLGCFAPKPGNMHSWKPQ